MAGAPKIDAQRVIADLRELARRTSDDRGAQRVAWSETWRDARAYLGELLAEIDVEPEFDPAANLWARVEAADPGAPALALGSHVDSVPDGGWLDGALGVIAAVGVLRAWAAASEPPPRPLLLVDWADEEGARFGRSLFGSSAWTGSFDPSELEAVRDADGDLAADVLAAKRWRCTPISRSLTFKWPWCTWRAAICGKQKPCFDRAPRFRIARWHAAIGIQAWACTGCSAWFASGRAITEEALGEFDREMKLANPNRLYGREYQMSALHARGMCLLEMGKPSEAIAAFQDGLAVYPEHGQTQVALTMAFRAKGSAGDEQSTRQKLAATLRTLTVARPIEAHPG